MQSRPETITHSDKFNNVQYDCGIHYIHLRRMDETVTSYLLHIYTHIYEIINIYFYIFLGRLLLTVSLSFYLQI